MHDARAPTFDNILDDLEGVLTTLSNAGVLSYRDLQGALTWKLNLHLINYIRFFEQQSWVRYDRISDQLEISPAGQSALADSDAWGDAVRDFFRDQIVPAQLEESTDPEQGAYDEYDDDYGDPTQMISGDALDALDLTSMAVPIEESEAELYEDSEVDEDLAERWGHEPDAAHGEPEPAVAVTPEPEAPTPDEAAPYAYDPDPEEAFEPEPEPEPVSRWDEPAPALDDDDDDHDADPYTSAAERDEPADEEPMTTDTYSSSRRSSISSAEGLYERQEEIGSGGVGTVYRAIQTRLNRPVAVKEIRNIFHVFADVQREDIVGRFVEIAQTQATLDHPNIIQVYDVVSDTDYPYVVMQHAPKGNLRKLIDTEGRPPLNVAMSYFMQILHALNAAHEQGVVHGGLKPENVVLDPAGNALLTDFGMTKVVERASGGASSQVYVGVGTVAYMSPEQFRDPNLASVQSDIYSLGIMFYEMLTGKVPGRRSPMPSSFYPDIPRKLDDVFDNMSMDDREDRYNNVREILREIYSLPEVLDIMDKRSGVLFLRDPLVHGELGLGEEAEDLPELPPSEATSDYGSYAVENDYEEYDSYAAPPSFEDEPEEEIPVADDAGTDADGVAAAEVDEDVADEPEEELEADGSAGDVLDKLNKYGALFEDDED